MISPANKVVAAKSGLKVIVKAVANVRSTVKVITAPHSERSEEDSRQN